MTPTARLCALALVVGVATLGCDVGSAGTSASEMVGAADTTSAPTDVPSAATAPAVTEQRIVPVDGDLAEIVFALGLGEQVVATDISATYPADADALPEVGYQRALAPEPILAFEPTTVLATDLAGPAETLDALDRLGVETTVIDRESTSDGPGNKIRAVAAALDVVDAGDELADSVDQAIAAARERAERAPSSPRVGVLYLRGESVQLLLGEGSGVDWLIEAAGATDIAADLGVDDYAAISAEALLAASPDALIVPERGLESVGGVDGLLDIDGIAETPAGRQRRILVYDDQYLLGNGPRTGALLDQLITDLHGDI
ncbi:heme/hemin ABC transporter substrate-binding protein [Ilumatobacter sp.]|uniref:heme/hemin ABC transporter substrate-binding protein n=1 Tax=Ilumatobacter sp. TaxID=1967498 RepID=UPI003C60F8EF